MPIGRIGIFVEAIKWVSGSFVSANFQLKSRPKIKY